MKKLLTIMMVLILSLSLAACAKEEVTLQSTTVHGLTLDVPNDFGAFEDMKDRLKCREMQTAHRSLQFQSV